MRRRRTIGFLVLAVLVGVVGGCSSEPADQADSAAVRVASTLRDDTITVGSFDFAESELLAEIYSQALEGDGYDVRRAFGLGPREFVLPALAGGLVEWCRSTPGARSSSRASAPTSAPRTSRTPTTSSRGLLAERGDHRARPRAGAGRQHLRRHPRDGRARGPARR